MRNAWCLAFDTAPLAALFLDLLVLFGDEDEDEEEEDEEEPPLLPLLLLLALLEAAAAALFARRAPARQARVRHRVYAAGMLLEMHVRVRLRENDAARPDQRTERTHAPAMAPAMAGCASWFRSCRRAAAAVAVAASRRLLCPWASSPNDDDADF